MSVRYEVPRRNEAAESGGTERRGIPAVLGTLWSMNGPERLAWIPLLRQAWADYQRHHAQWLAAALAYFTAFAIAPLIIVIVEIVGFFLHGHRHALDTIFAYMQQSLGPSTDAVRSIITATFNQPRRSVIAQVIGWAIFVVAALGLFSSLQFALNVIWEVPDAKRGFGQIVRERLFGFAMMLAVALLLLLSIVVNTALTAAARYLSGIFALLPTLLKAGDFVLSFVVVWLLFALIFEYLPDTRVAWKEVWRGAALTSLLFVVGQFLLGWYLGRTNVGSAYGVFGSLIVFLVWVNYSAQIVLFGAEFTHVYAQRNRLQTAQT